MQPADSDCAIIVCQQIKQFIHQSSPA